MIARTSLIDFSFVEDDSLDFYRSTDTFLDSKCSCGKINQNHWIHIVSLFCSEKIIKYKRILDCRVFLSEAVWIITSLVLTNTRTMQKCSTSFSIAVCSVSVCAVFVRRRAVWHEVWEKTKSPSSRPTMPLTCLLTVSIPHRHGEDSARCLLSLLLRMMKRGSRRR